MGCELEPAESLRTCLVRNESTRETQFLRHSPPSTPGVLGPPASLVEQVSGGRVSECTVIAIAAGALGLRLRTTAGAFGYAAEHGCAFYVDWLHDEDVPWAWDELFSPRVEPPPEGLAGVEATVQRA